MTIISEEILTMRNPKCYLHTSLLAVFVMLVSSSASFSLDENYVGLWLFDEGSGDILNDSSQYGNHGAINGGAEWVEGKFQIGLSFNGSDAYVEVPSSDSLKIEEQITIELWFLPRSQTSDLDIFRKHQVDGNTFNYEFYVTSGGILWPSLLLDGEALKMVTANIGGAQIPFDEWTHIAMTYDGETAICYINGEAAFEEPASGKIATSDDPLYIGCRDGTRRFIDGILDEFALSNVARTPDEIKEHFTEGFSGTASVDGSGKLATTWAALKNR
jgi:hypothetical protein